MVSKADRFFALRTSACQRNSVQRCIYTYTVFIGFSCCMYYMYMQRIQGYIQPQRRWGEQRLQVMLFLLSFAVGPTAALWDYFKGGLSASLTLGWPVACRSQGVALRAHSSIAFPTAKSFLPFLSAAFFAGFLCTVLASLIIEKPNFTQTLA